MTDSGTFFSKSQLKDEVFATREKYHSVLEQIKRIPHLRIPIEVDVKKMQREVTQIQTWAPNIIESEYWSESEIATHGANNLGRALIEFTPDSFFMKDTNSKTRAKEQVHFRQDGRLKYFITDLCHNMPYIQSLLFQVCDYPTRCRIMKIPGDYSVSWHSHHNFEHTEAPYFMAVLQIPIISSKCIYSVKSKNSLYTREHSQEYKEGSCYLFNSYHLHKVENVSPNPRVSLFATYSFDYEPFLRFLKPLVETYQGPLIEV